MTLPRDVAVFALAALWVVTTPSRLWAQSPAPENAEHGVTLFEQAFEAFGNKDFAKAAPLFEGAATYFPHCPTSTNYFGKCLEAMGRLGEAYEVYSSVDPVAPSSGEAPPCAEARREAGAKAKTLESQIGWVRLEIPSHGATQVGLTLLDAPEPASNRSRYFRPLPHAHQEANGSAERVWKRLPVAPGRLTVDWNDPAFPPRTVVVTRGTTVEVSLVPPRETVTSNDDSDLSAHDSRSKAWLWVGGAGVAALALGTVTGLVSASKTDDVKHLCDSAAQLCTPEGLTDRDSAETYGWISNLSFGVGIVGLAAAGVLYFTDGGANPAPPSARVTLKPGVAANAAAEGATLQVVW